MTRARKTLIALESITTFVSEQYVRVFYVEKIGTAVEALIIENNG